MLPPPTTRQSLGGGDLARDPGDHVRIDAELASAHEHLA
jgi:hypothetical protein